MRNIQVYLHTIATHVPETSYSQKTALDFMLNLMADTDKKRAFFKKIYEGSAISKRHTVIDDYGKDPSEYNFYPKNRLLKPEPSTAKRNEIYIREANRLSIETVTKLLEKMKGFDKNKITHIITVSCTGFSAPGVDFKITKEFKLSSSVHRFNIGFMGCFAAFPALKLARYICQSEPDARVLIVNVELCSLHFQQKQELDIIVANSLFADGITAALVSSNIDDSAGDKIILHDFMSQSIPDSEEMMAWSIGDTGYNMKLSVHVPQIIAKNINSVMSEFKNKTGIKPEEIELWAIHPGGRAILDKLWKTLGLSKEDLAVAYGVLNDYGNMSSATIMFVLERIMENEKKGKMFAAAFGPGLTVETGYFEKK